MLLVFDRSGFMTLATGDMKRTKRSGPRTEPWGTPFNASKTVYMPISNSTLPIQDLNLSINNSPIKRVNSHKHLGIVLNNKLIWTDHVESICKRASKKLGLLNRNRQTFSRNVLVKLYKSTILPMVEYGSVLYDEMSIGSSNI